MKVMIINGPNLNLLGIREPDIYGALSYHTLMKMVKNYALDKGVKVKIFQTNSEGKFIDKIHEAYYQHYDALIINPAAYTHTSIAILDALKAVNLPTIEVHLSDIYSREEFRKHSYVSEFCFKTIVGKGIVGYYEAIELLKNTSSLFDEIGGK